MLILLLIYGLQIVQSSDMTVNTTLVPLKTNTSWEIIGTSTLSSKSITAEFTLEFDEMACCPFILLIPSTMSRALSLKGKTCVLNPGNILDHMALALSTVLVVQPDEIDKNKSNKLRDRNNPLNCIMPSNGTYKCTGTLTGQSSYVDTRDVIIAYECKANKTIDLRYQVNFYLGPGTRCEKFEVNTPTCSDYDIQYVIMPNIYGLPRQEYANELMNYIGKTVWSSCYKYTREYFCRAIFQKCNPLEEFANRNFTPTWGYPCRETCYDIEKSCSKELAAFLEFNICGFYPSIKNDPNCFWPEITCEPPKSPKHGTVEVTGLALGDNARYSCTTFFMLNGNENRKCQASGSWNGSHPHCEPFTLTGILLITLLPSIFGLVLICSIILCCLHMKEITVLCYIKFCILFRKRNGVSGRQKDIYLLYDQENDKGFVQSCLIPLLQRYNIRTISEDNFVPGSCIFASLENMLKNCRCALVVLTSTLIQERRKLYHLNQVVCKRINEGNLKVVFLLCERPKSLGRIPKNLSLFLRLDRSIKKYKNGWQVKLIREIMFTTRSSLTKRLTIGNAVFADDVTNTSDDSGTDE